MRWSHCIFRNVFFFFLLHCLCVLAFYPMTSGRKLVLFVASFIQQTSCFCWKSPREFSAVTQRQMVVTEYAALNESVRPSGDVQSVKKAEALTAHFIFYKRVCLILWTTHFLWLWIVWSLSWARVDKWPLLSQPSQWGMDSCYTDDNHTLSAVHHNHMHGFCTCAPRMPF